MPQTPHAFKLLLQRYNWWNAMHVPGSDPLLALVPEKLRVPIGQDVDLWQTLTQGGVSAAQATGANRPTRVVDGVSFDGATDYMTLAGLTSASTDYTLYAVVTPDDLVAAHCILGSDGTAGWRSNTGGFVYLHDGTASRAGMSGTTRKQLLAFRLTASSNKVSFYRDGKKLAEATYDGTMSWAAAPTLGAFTTAAGFFQGTIHSTWLYASADSDAVMAARSAVLMARFGLEFSELSVAGHLRTWLSDVGVTGDPVDSVSVAEGSGDDLVGAGATRPVLSSINGNQTIAFDGDDDFLNYDGAKADHSHLHDGTGSTLIIGFVPRETGVTSVLIETCTPGLANVGFEYILQTAGNGLWRIANGSGVSLSVNVAIAGGTHVVDTPSVTVFRTETGAANEYEMRNNGVVKVSGVFLAAVSPADPDDVLYLASRTGATLWSKVDYRQVSEYTRNLNDYEVAALESLAASRMAA